jgi:hypothetical protein
MSHTLVYDNSVNIILKIVIFLNLSCFSIIYGPPQSIFVKGDAGLRHALGKVPSNLSFWQSRLT